MSDCLIEMSDRFKVYYNPFHSNFQLPLKAIKLLEKRERKEGHKSQLKLRFHFKKLQQLQHTCDTESIKPMHIQNCQNCPEKK